MRRLFPLAIAVVVAIAGMLLLDRLGSDPQPATPEEIAQAVAAAATPTPAIDPATIVYQAIFPSLVLIQTKGGDGSAAGDSLGSGVIINADGSILTALHVVEGAARITVTFADGTVSDAAVVSADDENDLAVLLADEGPEVIVPATMGGGVQVGDQAFAVGNPLGFVASLSAGVISGLERTVPLKGGEKVLRGLIQFDAAVNPGSSGGPLLNRNGQVVGVVTALANPGDSNSFNGIGFAVPLGSGGGAGGGPPR